MKISLTRHALYDVFHRHVRTLLFSPVHTKKIGRRFQKSLVWGPFLKTCVVGARKRRLRVDGRLKRIKNLRFQK